MDTFQILSNMACNGLRSLKGTDFKQVKMEQEDPVSKPSLPENSNSDTDTDTSDKHEATMSQPDTMDMKFEDALNFLACDAEAMKVR